MEIIKKFRAIGDVKNQPGRVCVRTLTPRIVRRMARLAKESPRITAGKLQRLFESWGQKVSTYITTSCLGGLPEKKPLLSINNKLKCLQFAKCYWDFQ